jgi:c-di-GMP-related signal transduction protein
MAAGSPDWGSHSLDTFVARQPIFDRGQKVIGYELLFRSGPENFFRDFDSDLASSSIISDAMHVFGLRDLVGGKQAFINVSRRILLDGLLTLMPAEAIVIELLESVEPDAEVITACQALKKLGYTIALDDFVFNPAFEALIPLIDIIKVDFTITGREERESLHRRFSPGGVLFLAEKVETREEFQEARSLGYTYFQGYFFCRPQIMSRKGISASKRSTLQLIQQINEPEMDIETLENTIRQDPILTLQLLRYLNSASLGLRVRINSIKHALLMLGEGPLKNWASLILLGALAKDKPGELLLTSLIRAQFCETAGKHSPVTRSADELFLMGMLSTFDAILDVPIDQVLAEMRLSEDLIAALNGSGGKLGPLYSLVRLVERGHWAGAAARASEIGISDLETAQFYREAVIWADEVHKLGV